MNNIKTTFLLAYAGFLALGLRADAHAFLEQSAPAVGSEIATSPQEIQLRFSEKLEPAFSEIKVYDASGQEIDKKDCHVSPKNPTELAISVPALKAGKYKVTWKVLSRDTHTTKGDFTFRVTEKVAIAPH